MMVLEDSPSQDDKTKNFFVVCTSVIRETPDRCPFHFTRVRLVFQFVREIARETLKKIICPMLERTLSTLSLAMPFPNSEWLENPPIAKKNGRIAQVSFCAMCNLEATSQGINPSWNRKKKICRWQGETTQNFYTYSSPKKDELTRINRIAVNQIRMRVQFQSFTIPQRIPEVFHNNAQHPTIENAKRLGERLISVPSPWFGACQGSIMDLIKRTSRIPRESAATRAA